MAIKINQMPQQPIAPSGQWAINQAIPGLPGLTTSATNIIANALSGIPSPSQSRLENAYFGSASGLDPTSDFLRNRGFDLYKAQANAQQQQGLGNLNNLVGAYSGNVAPTPGQEMQNAQFGQQLAQQGSQFGANLGFEREQWQTQLDLLQKYLGGPAGGTGSYLPNYNGQTDYARSIGVKQLA